ncbi:polyphenol oxidase family protein [Slackia sp.]|uniref:polyphenol oxidase family protein n=1 Tax=Slackia sp. TaxID=2049041 RepID=UPI00399BC624
MTECVKTHDSATLDLPYPRLAEGRFSSCAVLTDDALNADFGVRICFTQRTGGESEPPYDSLNLGDHVQDDPECVGLNRRKLFCAFGMREDAVIVPKQVHGDAIVACKNRSDYAHAVLRAQNGADGVIVSCDEVGAMLCFADCAPVIVVSPRRTFAVVHAGWRGVMARIAQSAVKRVCEMDGIGPSCLNVYIGPHIHACHFEVGEDLARRFSDEFGLHVLVDDCHVSLSAALRSGLISVGVDERRIADAGVCTVCDGGKRYFSYRASGGRCGRHAAFAVRCGNGKEGL